MPHVPWGALGERASPSVRVLVEALSHGEPHVRIYAAEALRSSVRRRARRFRTSPEPWAIDSRVRWAAGEALAGIGPAAQLAVPQLIEALKDEFLYVRICAAGALGSIGPKAQTAREALIASANDFALRDQAEWALNRIAGVEAGKPVVPPHLPEPSVPLQPRTAAVKQAILPLTGIRPRDGTSSGASSWETKCTAVPWLPAMVVYVGADNTRQINPAFQEHSGVLMAFRATDGAFLWQDPAPRGGARFKGVAVAFDDQCSLC